MSQPARILFFDHTAKPGGGELAMLDLLKFIDRDRFTPIVLLGEDGPMVKRVHEIGVECHVLPMPASVKDSRKDKLGRLSLSKLGKLLTTIRYSLRLRRWIQARQPDVIITNSLKADIIGALANAWTGIPLVWYVHDRIAVDYLPSKVVRVFRYLARRLPNFVIANSHASYETLMLPDDHPGTVIHCGVPVDSIVDDVGPPSDESPVVGIVGRLSHWKGQHVFIDAAARIAESCPNVRFQIVGAPLFDEHDYEQQIREQVRDLNLIAHVEFTGFRNDVPELMRRMSVLVHASITGEPFGKVVIEGMAMGKPVVATAGGGIPEIIEPDRSGILVPMNDASAIADAVIRLLQQPQSAMEIGRAATNRVQEMFTIERGAKRLEQVCDGVLAR